MNVCGIITEYNPMHMGHDYQLNAAKQRTEAEGTILVMSGNFVQRGEPAIIDKYARARAAIHEGIDLVVELPVYFSTASAEFFSGYAIKLLNSTGIVTHLNFGSESGDIQGLTAIANILATEPLGYSHLLNGYLKKGFSYPKARAMALGDYVANHQLMDESLIAAMETPNNILGIEYLKALKRLDSPIKATTVKRIGATYHDEDSARSVPSATSLRRHIKEGHPLHLLKDKVPKASYTALVDAIEGKRGPVFVQDIFPFLKDRLLTASPKELRAIQDVSEGLENRILKGIDQAITYDELIDGLMTKRYTRTKLARTLLHIYLNHKASDFKNFYEDMAPYLKVLALNQKGQQLIRAIKEANEDLPIITNNRQGYKKLDTMQRECFMADLNSTRLYNHLVQSAYGTVLKNDYQQQIIPS